MFFFSNVIVLGRKYTYRYIQMFSKISHAYINADTYAGRFFRITVYICISVFLSVQRYEIFEQNPNNFAFFSNQALLGVHGFSGSVITVHVDHGVSSFS